VENQAKITPCILKQGQADFNSHETMFLPKCYLMFQTVPLESHGLLIWSLHPGRPPTQNMVRACLVRHSLLGPTTKALQILPRSSRSCRCIGKQRGSTPKTSYSSIYMLLQHPLSRFLLFVSSWPGDSDRAKRSSLPRIARLAISTNTSSSKPAPVLADMRQRSAPMSAEKGSASSCDTAQSGRLTL
jgi:hypothetical protein